MIKEVKLKFQFFVEKFDFLIAVIKDIQYINFADKPIIFTV